MATNKQIADFDLDRIRGSKTVEEIRQAVRDAKLLLEDTVNNLETEFGVVVDSFEMRRDLQGNSRAKARIKIVVSDWP